ncbi:exported hypothetical protein [Mesorhizobium sp. SOD10]|nr:exported hypothetical protein [Mesorhizobium sp. SOD10]
MASAKTRTHSASAAAAMNLVRRNAASFACASASNRTGARAGADCDMEKPFPVCTRLYLVAAPPKRLLEAWEASRAAIRTGTHKKLTRLFSYIPLQSGIVPNYGPYSAQANISMRIPCGSRARPIMRCAS